MHCGLTHWNEILTTFLVCTIIVQYILEWNNNNLAACLSRPCCLISIRIVHTSRCWLTRCVSMLPRSDRWNVNPDDSTDARCNPLLPLTRGARYLYVLSIRFLEKLYSVKYLSGTFRTRHNKSSRVIAYPEFRVPDLPPKANPCLFTLSVRRILKPRRNVAGKKCLPAGA